MSAIEGEVVVMFAFISLVYALLIYDYILIQYSALYPRITFATAAPLLLSVNLTNDANV